MQPQNLKGVTPRPLHGWGLYGFFYTGLQTENFYAGGRIFLAVQNWLIFGGVFVSFDLDSISGEMFTEDARQLFDALTFDGMPSDGLALAVEAARIKTRLDLLNRVLVGSSDFFLQIVEDGGKDLTLKVDPVLAESRQLATVFRQTVEAVRRGWPVDGDDGEEDDLAGL